jgi:hypothetical protein
MLSKRVKKALAAYLLREEIGEDIIDGGFIL